METFIGFISVKPKRTDTKYFYVYMRNIIIFIDTFNSIVLTLDVVWVAIYAMQVGKQRKKFKKINKEIDLAI